MSVLKTKEEVKRQLNPHLLNFLRIENNNELINSEPLNILSPNRLDVMAKHLYARFFDKKYPMDWADKVYKEHLRILTGFEEQDGSGKKGYKCFVECYQRLLLSIKQNGFEKDKGWLPITEKGDLVDGSHRLAASIYFHKKVPVLKVGHNSHQFGASFFSNAGLPKVVLESLVLEYCRIKPSVKVAVLFPVGAFLEQTVRGILRAQGVILYEKSLHLTYQGRINLISNLYEGEDWVETKEDISPGVIQHVSERFQAETPVLFYFFESNQVDKLIEIKKNIRNLIGLGNNSLHINDTARETERLAEIILNENGVHWLNNARCGTMQNFRKLFDQYKEWLRENTLDNEKFCLDGSAALAAYGLRDVGDLDYLVYGSISEECPHQSVSNHQEEIIFHKQSLEEIIFHPENYFYFNGVKIVSLKVLAQMKACRNELKDQNDLARFKRLIDNQGNQFWLEWELKLKLVSTRAKLILFRTIKKWIPKPLHPIAKQVLRIPFLIYQLLGPYEKEILYQGYKLQYSRGTSLIEGIKYQSRLYESELTSVLVNVLRNNVNPSFLDIGANIGLMTLNVLALVPNVRVFAFEPGPHQANFFEKTIQVNQLADRVILYKVAVSDSSGQSQFAVHVARHSSGDGFLDTGRAGKTNKVLVNVTTIDEWWDETGRSPIHAVKMDIEGAEYLALKGASQFLTSCRPIIFLEIQEVNIAPYQHSIIDLLQLLGGYGYKVQTLKGHLVTIENYKEYGKTTSEFQAIPLR